MNRSLPPFIYGREAGPNERVWTEPAIRDHGDACASAERETLEAENHELRVILSRVTQALGNGAFASSACSLQFLRYIPDEVKAVVDGLRARDRSAKHQDAQRLGPEGVEPGRDSDAPR